MVILEVMYILGLSDQVTVAQVKTKSSIQYKSLPKFYHTQELKAKEIITLKLVNGLNPGVSLKMLKT